MEQRRRFVDELVEAIKKKVEAHRAALEDSAGFGQVTWRRKPNGQLEITLKLDL